VQLEAIKDLKFPQETLR